jgi:hypothetical protein
MPNALGLRRVDPEHVAEIKKSIEDYGFHDTAPIIIDDLGRILSGRHRLEVERQLGNGEMWRRERLKGLSGREAVQIAMASNVDRPWTAPDYKRLDKMKPRHSGFGRKSSLLC